MPFTAAHPAAVIPLVRRDWRVDRAALVCGAIAPDFEYFVRARLESSFSHTLVGLAFTLPMSIVLVLLWELVLRDPILASLPPSGRARARAEAPPGLERDASAWALLVACAVLGVLTHIGWDAFTHHGGPGVELVPILQTPVGLGSLGEVPAYRVVQHASTVVGACAIAWHIAQLPRRCSPEPPNPRIRRWLVVSTAIGAATLPWLRHGIPDSLPALWNLRGNLLVASLSGGMAGLLLTAFLARPGGRVAGRVPECASSPGPPSP